MDKIGDILARVPSSVIQQKRQAGAANAHKLIVRLSGKDGDESKQNIENYRNNNLDALETLLLHVMADGYIENYRNNNLDALETLKQHVTTEG